MGVCLSVSIMVLGTLWTEYLYLWLLPVYRGFLSIKICIDTRANT